MTNTLTEVKTFIEHSTFHEVAKKFVVEGSPFHFLTTHILKSGVNLMAGAQINCNDSEYKITFFATVDEELIHVGIYTAKEIHQRNLIPTIINFVSNIKFNNKKIYEEMIFSLAEVTKKVAIPFDVKDEKSFKNEDGNTYTTKSSKFIFMDDPDFIREEFLM